MVGALDDMVGALDKYVIQNKAWQAGFYSILSKALSIWAEIDKSPFSRDFFCASLSEISSIKISMDDRSFGSGIGIMIWSSLFSRKSGEPEPLHTAISCSLTKFVFRIITR